MSQPPPPSPYALPGGPPPPRRGRSNVAKFWIGVALCIPLMFLVGLLEAVPSIAADALSLPEVVPGIAAAGINLALFAAVIVGLVLEKTRFLVLGILACLAVLLVVAAGACVVLLAGLGSSY
jgi:hypothetical protein